MSEAPGAHTPQKCRFIRSTGVRCRSRALRGRPFCYTHAHQHHTAYEVSCYAPIKIPFLDCPTAIQHVATDIVRHLIAGTIDYIQVRHLNSTLRVAALALRQPSAANQALQELEDSIDETTPGPDGVDLAPAEPYLSQAESTIPELPLKPTAQLPAKSTESLVVGQFGVND